MVYNGLVLRERIWMSLERVCVVLTLYHYGEIPRVTLPLYH